MSLTGTKKTWHLGKMMPNSRAPGVFSSLPNSLSIILEQPRPRRRNAAGAISSNLQPRLAANFCAKINTMMENQETEVFDGTAAINGGWNLKIGPLVPQSLHFNVVYEHRQVISLKFHASVEDDEIGGLICCFDIDFYNCTVAPFHCLENHESCSSQNKSWYPTCLPYVCGTALGTNYIKLVERVEVRNVAANTSPRYFPLSYVWGNVSTIKLSKPNEDDFKRGIKMVILNVSIVQDDFEDWARESFFMDLVYRNSVCNIAACDGINSSPNIFSQQILNVNHILRIYQEYSDRAIQISLLSDWVNWI
ncbi:uncharacterized protein BDR25DRAFT_355906 [Lindgomyces ingoldianus]|uniref:Uncharacterized protein n=1 Tax=Lindgomyces ingoldianus TaxID=673940 RepID=A0ACB6QT94_9PLEO|nr:uncharacterized protein BDR25DRAFT_355906 [Lindgomyces ingoldianus]KAF2470203.1 hypothetical protein BDR25DRAFT_355906 [Lindgomyces ingoldianus]